MRYKLSVFFLAQFIFVFSGSICAQPSLAQGQRRVALLIGNSDYKEVSILPNPKNDTELIAKTFKDAGFDVIELSHDLDRAKMVKAIRSFEDRAQGSDIGVIFYAGHGIEVNGTNYLIPIDAKLASDKDIEDEAVSLDRLIKALDGVKQLRLVILDACRDNPFVPKMTRSAGTRSISRGLAQIEPVNADTLIAFAAKAGTVAQDGTGGNSPYSSAIAKHITTQGLDIRIALGRIRDDVLKSTNKAQEPFLYGSLGGDIITLASRKPEADGSNSQSSPEPKIKDNTSSTSQDTRQNSSSQKSISSQISSLKDPPITTNTLPSSMNRSTQNAHLESQLTQQDIMRRPNDEFWRVRLNVSQGIQNVRSGPGTSNDILFTIPAGFGGITVRGCKEAAKGSSSSWCLVKWQDKLGWLSMNGIEKDPQKK